MLLWIIAIVIIVAFIYLFMFREKKKVKSLYKYMTLEDLTTASAVYFKDRLHMQGRTLTSQEQLTNAIEEKYLLKRTIEEARAGSYKARVTLIDEIEAFLVGSAMNITTLDQLSCIVFRDPDLMTSNEKFETMMHFIQKEIYENLTPEDLYDEDNQAHLKCFEEFLRITEALSMPRPLATAPHHEGYYINEDDIEKMFAFFMREKGFELQVVDAVCITSIIVYQKLFGYGPVDTLVYDNSIDEIEIGTCGADFGSARHVVSPLNSTMISVKNTLLRLQFLTFETQAAMENCIVALASNGEGTFTADDGYKYTTLRQLRRVTVRRPPAADRFSVNIRKLDYEVKTNKQLLEWNTIPVKGTKFVQDSLQLFAWSLICLTWTGEQASGKTSHTNAYIDLLEPDVGIRALGNIDESQFGNRYPERDIQYLFETIRQSAHEIAGVGRRTKGTFLFLAEVITAEWGQEAINNFKSGYVGGMLTGHGDTTEAMIEFMAQLLAMGQSTSSIETTKIVASVLNINVKTMKYGNVFCYEGIYEIIPRSWSIDWNTVHADSMDEAVVAAASNQQLYFKNSLDPALYVVSPIMLFNKETNTYETKNPPSLGLCAKIFFRLAKKRRKFFVNYMKYYFKLDLIQMLVDAGILIVTDVQNTDTWL